ncbi:DUF4349 domain-containing protein [Glycomyces sp. L485]|uniref:DUF4349 domain-containing protein n=1 Tax=Glycomyces sp. L485 TaxID=2909235 RepID=UPI001F4A3B90|nr:DUF4349 domain-containing protein [Glycomyces sp. L485]MCH7232809.1 DUF4349 domain-containing protein [Glycomyces sp. L485]
MKLLRAPAALLLAVLVATGCSSSDGGTDAARVESGAVPEESVDGAAPGAAQFDVAEQRDLIYVGTLDALDPDPVAVAEQVWATAESYGGLVTADRRHDDESGARAELTVRIPSERFGEAVEALAGLAEEEIGRTVDTEDVTGQAVDLESSIATRRASLERVRELLADASSVEAILDLEAEIADREAALASLESQLADLQDRVALSTITYIVSTPEETEEVDGSTGPGNFAEAVGTGWSGVTSLLRVASIVLGVLLPFTPLIAVVLAAIFVPLWYVRRSRRRSAI